MFNSIFKRNRVNSVTGSPFVNDLGLVFNEDGSKELKVKGVHDAYAEIQSHADSVNIHVILDRYQRGDIGVLQNRIGFYADASEMPTSVVEWLQLQADATAFFKKLDPKIQNEFNNDVNQFMASIGTPEFNAVFADKKSDSVVNEEVKEVSDNE